MRISIVKVITISAGDTQIIDFFTVPEGREFDVQMVMGSFESSNKAYVRFTILYGEQQVIPYEGEITGTEALFWTYSDYKFPPTSTIRVKVVNEDTNDHVVVVSLVGELKKVKG